MHGPTRIARACLIGLLTLPLSAAGVNAADDWLAVAPGGQLVHQANGAPQAPEIVIHDAGLGGIDLTVELTGLALDARQTKGGRFVELSWPGAAVFGEIGGPALPVVRKLFVLPEGAAWSVQVDEGLSTTTLLADAVLPVQAPIVKLPGAIQNAPFDINPGAYALDQMLPEQRVTVTELGIVRGHFLCLLEVRPVAYNPAAGQLTVWPAIDVDIAFEGGRAPGKNVRSLGPDTGQVLNPPAAPENPTPGNYLIVVPTTFEAGITPFVQGKTAQGYIVSTHVVAPGTSNTTIKNHIQSLWGTPAEPEFVLLVGDTNTIPCWVGGGTGSPDTDLPYVCMDGPGDWYPDIANGRFPVRSLQQLADVIDKTLFHEAGQYPDPDYTTRAVFMASEDNYTVSEGTHNYVIDTYMDPLGFTSDKLYCHTYNATTQQVRDSFNDGRWYGIYSGHGATTYWADGPHFDQSDVNGLTNYGMYSFVCSFACVTGSFENVTECFTETWILAPEKGAAAIYGSSVNSYWDEDDWLERYLFDTIYLDEVGEVSKAWQDTLLLRYLPHYGPTDFTRRYFEMYNLMGDPSLRVVGEPEPGFALAVNPPSQTVCAPADASYTVDVIQILGYTEPVTLGASGHPAGTTVAFTTNPVTPPGTTTMIVSNTGAAAPGDYTIEITGNSPTITQYGYAEMLLANAAPAPVVLLSPPNGAGDVSRTPTLAWNPSTQVVDYDLEVSTTPNFTGVIYSQTLTGTSHTVGINLESFTTYYWHVKADNGCGTSGWSDAFSFTTLTQPDYFTEFFDGGGFDLDNWTVEIIPDGSGDFYRICGYESTSLPTDPAGGTSLVLSDDDYATVSPGTSVYLYGNSYATFYVGSNGYVTFDSGDTDYSESLEDHFSQIRISGLFDDLNPSQGGTVSWKATADRVAVTWQNVPEYYATGANTFQIELFFNGEIHITWTAIGSSDSIVGLSNGGGVPFDYEESDFSAVGPCTLPCPCDINGDGVVDVLDLLAVLAAWGNTGGPEDVNGDGVVNVLDLLEVLSAWGACP